MDKKRGFSLVEMLIAAAISTVLIGVVFGLLKTGQASFFNADANMDIRNSLRIANEKISSELRQTGYAGGVAQFTVSNGTGPNNSDTIRFSVPILCTTTSGGGSITPGQDTILDANGNPAYWGAPLTWGCDSASCMDLNNNCTVQEYKFVLYALNGTNLERSVLNSALAVVGSATVIATNISDFQITNPVVGNKITYTLTGQKVSAVKKTVTMTLTNNVYINNFGG